MDNKLKIMVLLPKLIGDTVWSLLATQAFQNNYGVDVTFVASPLTKPIANLFCNVGDKVIVPGQGMVLPNSDYVINFYSDFINVVNKYSAITEIKKGFIEALPGTAESEYWGDFSDLSMPQTFDKSNPHIVDDFIAQIHKVFPEVLSHPHPLAVQNNIKNTASQCISINVATSKPTKNYPHEKWIAAATELAKNGHHIVFVGGPNDQSQALQDVCANHPNMHNAIGQPLAATINIIQQSAIHISGDTGTAHIANAMGVPTITLFGPTNPIFCQPYFASHRTILQAENHITADIVPAKIVTAAQQLLKVRKLPKFAAEPAN